MPCGRAHVEDFLLQEREWEKGVGEGRDQPLGTGTAEEKREERDRRWKGNPTNVQRVVAAAEDAICQDPKGRASTEA